MVTSPGFAPFHPLWRQVTSSHPISWQSALAPVLEIPHCGTGRVAPGALGCALLGAL